MSQITRKSIETGNINTMELPITAQQVKDWRDGDKTAFTLFPELNPVQMDFLLTGVTPEEKEQIILELIESGELEDYERMEAEMAYA